MREASDEKLIEKTFVSDAIKNPRFKNEFVIESEYADNKTGKLIQQLHNPATGEWRTKEVKV